uniref:WD_REPEATS_REGION domain-containing protein n=1 Tax=Heterorhabditis bacteriophora TaxID=37862 RepID=A0A1I7XMW8_HETBA
MITTKKCEYGTLVKHSESQWFTNNKISENYPNRFASLFYPKRYLKENCLIIETKVYSHFNQSRPTNILSDLSKCDYLNGYCATKDNEVMIWDVNRDQKCKYISIGKFNGFYNNGLWINKENQIALNFNKTISKVKDCGNSLILSDEGFAVKKIAIKRSIPKEVESKIPKEVESKIPMRIPKEVDSKIPMRVQSKIPMRVESNPQILDQKAIITTPITFTTPMTTTPPKQPRSQIEEILREENRKKLESKNFTRKTKRLQEQEDQRRRDLIKQEHQAAIEKERQDFIKRRQAEKDKRKEEKEKIQQAFQKHVEEKMKRQSKENSTSEEIKRTKRDTPEGFETERFRRDIYSDFQTAGQLQYLENIENNQLRHTTEIMCNIFNDHSEILEMMIKENPRGYMQKQLNNSAIRVNLIPDTNVVEVTFCKEIDIDHIENLVVDDFEPHEHDVDGYALTHGQIPIKLKGFGDKVWYYKDNIISSKIHNKWNQHNSSVLDVRDYNLKFLEYKVIFHEHILFDTKTNIEEELIQEMREKSDIALTLHSNEQNSMIPHEILDDVESFFGKYYLRFWRIYVTIGVTLFYIFIGRTFWMLLSPKLYLSRKSKRIKSTPEVEMQLIERKPQEDNNLIHKDHKGSYHSLIVD